MFDNLDLSSLPDENTRELVGQLLNLVEKLCCRICEMPKLRYNACEMKSTA